MAEKNPKLLEKYTCSPLNITRYIVLQFSTIRIFTIIYCYQFFLGVQDSAWKVRLEALETLRKKIAILGPDIPSQAVLRLLRTVLKFDFLQSIIFLLNHNI